MFTPGLGVCVRVVCVCARMRWLATKTAEGATVSEAPVSLG